MDKYEAQKGNLLTFLLLICLLVFGSLGLISCEANPTVQYVPPQNGYPNSFLLVSTKWLSDHLEQEDMRILDIRLSEDYL